MEIKAFATYTARGVSEQFQTRLLNVIGATTQTSVTTSTSTNTSQRWVPWDPLAQTFSINEPTGIMITSVGVYFSKKPTTHVTIRCQIRDVVNGYPGSRVLAEKSLTPADITVNDTAMVETKFTFFEPVYIEGFKEYCVVLLSESSDYRVWISRMGEQQVGTTNLVTSQPTLGSLFKSQNGSTWTPEQLEDLAFKIYRARFDISKKPDITFVNKNISPRQLPRNPFYAVTGLTKVRVNHPEHGFVNGDKVTFSGLVNGNGHTFTNGGLSTTVSDVEFDSYIITLATTATATGPFGGTSVRATNNIQFSSVIPRMDISSFTNTDFSVTIKPMQTSYVENEDYIVLNNSEVNMPTQMMIASHENEVASFAGQRSFKLRTTLISNNTYVSPIINKTRSSLMLTRNKINNPTYDELNDSELDDVVLMTEDDISFDYNENVPAESWLMIDGASFISNVDKFDLIAVGKYIVVDTDDSTTTNQGRILHVTGIEKKDDSYKIFFEPDQAMTDETDVTASLILKTRFVSDIAPNDTSNFASSITKRMVLKVPSDYIRVTLDANIPAETTLEVYYRSAMSNEFVSLENQRWYKLNPNVELRNSDEYIEYVFEQDNLKIFDQVQVKLVLKSTDESKAPRIKNLRVMALS